MRPADRFADKEPLMSMDLVEPAPPRVTAQGSLRSSWRGRRGILPAPAMASVMAAVTAAVMAAGLATGTTAQAATPTVRPHVLRRASAGIIPIAGARTAVRAAAGAGGPGPALAWGDGGYGELGDGGDGISYTPVQVSLPAGTTLTQVSAGYNHDLGVTSTGGVLAWGNNGSGELGDGTTTSSSIPDPVALPAGATATQVAAGDGFSVALTSTGSVYTWGDNSTGELGDGTTGGTSDVPVPVSFPGTTTITGIAAGSGFALALTSTGAVYSWGDDFSGQLGNGTTGGTSDTPVAVSVPSGTTVSAVSAQAGGSSALARTSAGQALAWGSGGEGNLGDGSTSDSAVPVPVSLAAGTTVTQISAGGSFDLALTSTGSVLAWGGGFDGQLGDGTTTGSDVPVVASIPAGTSVASVSAGATFALAVTTGGSALSWGANSFGQLGNGTTTGGAVPAQVSLPAGTTLSAVSAGEDDAAAIVAAPPTVTAISPSTGPAYGGTPVTITGTGFTGSATVHFGTRAATSSSVTSATSISATSPPGSGTVDVTVSAAAGSSVDVPADRFSYVTIGSTLAWGFGGNGELGNGSTTGSPVAVAPSLPGGTAVVATATESSDSLAVASTGKVFAWGANAYGQLGNATTTGSDVPVSVSMPAGTTVTAVAGEYYGGLALTSTGKVYAWGYNGGGALGNGTTTSSDVPVAVSLPAGTTVTAIAGETYGGLALTSTGKVYAWGSNADGELGNGTTTGSDVPVAVSLPPGITVTAIASELADGLAVTSTGKVYGWGYNGDGELGNGTATDSHLPVAVSLPAGTTVTAIAGEFEDGVALTSTGSVYAWGDNALGELGIGTTTASLSPAVVSLPAGTTARTIGSEAEDGLVVTTTGRVLAWGDNSSGETGTGAAGGGPVATPVAVSLPPGVVVTSVSRGFDLTALATASAPPLVTSISPTIGPPAGGTAVTVTGLGFTGASAVHFGTTAALSFSITSPTSLVADSPAGVGAVDVTVTGPNGTSSQVAGDRFIYLADGSVVDWGYNAYGDLGNGTTGGQSNLPVVPSLPPGTTVTSTTTEGDTGLALTSTGKVYAWGYGATGDLGNGTTIDSSVPVAVSLPAGTTVTAVAGAYHDGYALTSTGKVYAWGYNADGELGNGTTTGSDVPVAVSLPAGTTVIAISGEAYGGLAVTSTGKVYAWGYNSDGELGNGTTTASEVPIAVPLPAGTTVTAVSGGYYDGLALTSTGKVYAWGYNADGELGDGNTTGSLLPAAVDLPAGVTVTALADESYGSLALTSTGRVYAWGYNGYGQLGNGTTTSSDVPVAVELPVGVTARAIGSGYNLGEALTSSGSVLSWGYGGWGSLGDGSDNSSDTPVAVSLPAGVTISALGQGFDGGIALVGPPPGAAVAALYVTNTADNAVTSYASGASGDARPLTTVSGPATGLGGPRGVVVDSAGHLFVANQTANSVTEYARAATGDVSPLATISGAGTGLNRPQGLTMDLSGDLFVANAGGDSVTEYHPGQTGDATPAATITGTLTGLSAPQGLTVSASGDLFVTNKTHDSVTEYAKGANGNVKPLATIQGPATGLGSPVGVQIDSLGHLRVTNPATGTVTAYAVGANGDLAPLSVLSGSKTALHLPGGLDVNAAGQVAVAETGSNSITVFGPAATGNTAPSTIITGTLTGLDAPAFAAFTPPPGALTGPATATHSSCATLHGEVTPDGSVTSWSFQYRPEGATTWLGTPMATAGSGGASTPVVAVVSRLRAVTTYQYRLVATNPGGTTYGATRAFKTT